MAKVWVVLLALTLALHVAARGSVQKAKQQALQQQHDKESTQFDWNFQTALAGIGVTSFDGTSTIYAPRTPWPGRIYTTTPGGHNFATRRAVDWAIAKAEANGGNNLQQLVTMMKVANKQGLVEDRDAQSVGVYALLYGNFQNEIRVNLDADSGMALAARAYMKLNFRNDPEITTDHDHSTYWNAATGYSSANPIHSMLQSTKDPAKNVAGGWTQARSYAVLKNFATNALSSAISLLRADNGAISVATRKKYPAPWAKALRYIGGVLHLVQDSACACTPKHWTLRGAAAEVTGCIAGDGHGVIEYFPQESKWKVTGLSDVFFYDGRLHNHEQLDRLYAAANVLPISSLLSSNQQIESRGSLYGSFDPAIAGGKILLDVVAAVNNKSTPPASAAAAIVAAHVTSRYVDPSKLRMPSIEESTCKKIVAQRKPVPTNCAKFK